MQNENSVPGSNSLTTPGNIYGVFIVAAVFSLNRGKREQKLHRVQRKAMCCKEKTKSVWEGSQTQSHCMQLKNGKKTGQGLRSSNTPSRSILGVGRQAREKVPVVSFSF